MMSRISKGHSWREAADGEEEGSSVQGDCGNEVRNDVLQTYKQPGVKAREEALNGEKKSKGRKRGSTGKEHESDARQDREESERMEQESSWQHTHKHARPHPHAHNNNQAHINDHTQAQTHIYTHTHLSNETGDRVETEALEHERMQTREEAAAGRHTLMGARKRSDSSDSQERAGVKRRADDNDSIMKRTNGDRREGRGGGDDGGNPVGVAEDEKRTGLSSRSTGRSSGSSSGERRRTGESSTGRNDSPVKLSCEPCAALSCEKRGGELAAASVERPAQGTTSAELAPANGGSTTLAAVGTCRAAAGKPPTPVRSQRCNIEATDGRRTGNDEGCRKSDADEEDDVHEDDDVDDDDGEDDEDDNDNDNGGNNGGDDEDGDDDDDDDEEEDDDDDNNDYNVFSSSQRTSNRVGTRGSR